MINVKRYAIAKANLYDNINKVHIVEANNPREAIFKATGDNKKDFEGYTMEDILQNYFDGDILISEPVEI